MNNNFLTTQQAAERLGIDISTVTLMLRDGRLRGVKYGRDWLIDAASLEGLKVQQGPGRPRKAPA